MATHGPTQYDDDWSANAAANGPANTSQRRPAANETAAATEYAQGVARANGAIGGRNYGSVGVFRSPRHRQNNTWVTS